MGRHCSFPWLLTGVLDGLHWQLQACRLPCCWFAEVNSLPFACQLTCWRCRPACSSPAWLVMLCSAAMHAHEPHWLAASSALQEVPGEALLPGDIASIGRPKGGAGADDKVVPAGKQPGRPGSTSRNPFNAQTAHCFACWLSEVPHAHSLQTRRNAWIPGAHHFCGTALTDLPGHCCRLPVAGGQLHCGGSSPDRRVYSSVEVARRWRRCLPTRAPAHQDTQVGPAVVVSAQRPASTCAWPLRCRQCKRRSCRMTGGRVPRCRGGTLCIAAASIDAS